MAFEWNKMYKWEENYERTIDDDIAEYVCEQYGVESIEDLTEDQIKEIQAYQEEFVSEYSVMNGGFFRLYNTWEDYQE
jgi:hypothetical protein